jgi:hypothetical protein
LDPHLLQGLADAITATTIHDVILHNLLIPIPTLPINTPATGHSPTVINAARSDLYWKAITDNLTHRRSWILLKDESQTDTLKTYLSKPTLTTIPTDSVSVWGSSFWMSPETNDNPIIVYASTLVTPHQRTRILDTIYMRMTKGGKLSSNPMINPLKLSPETPANIVSLLHSSNSPAGIITAQITRGWSQHPRNAPLLPLSALRDPYELV